MPEAYNRKNDLLHPENSQYAFAPDNMDEAEDYLGFASNGMTDNEKIDEFNYFDNYLDERSLED
ncbi:MAG: hypothetical protein IJ861_08950 [Clostridia bacterium]|nr:hypothetical protein [Clostridia bacterium]